jgi:hypothetical protein
VWVIILAIEAWQYFWQYNMAKMANIIAIYTKTRNTILEFQSLGNTIDVFLILFPTLYWRASPGVALAPRGTRGINEEAGDELAV